MSLVSTHLKGMDAEPGTSDEQQEAGWLEKMAAAIEAADVLERNLGNPVHYDSNSPTSCVALGEMLTPSPGFTYTDLLDFGMTGEHGYAGFLRNCGFPPDAQETLIVRAAGLLLLEDAVKALDRNDLSYAAHLMYQASSMAERLTLLTWQGLNPDRIQEAIDARLSAQGRRAGKVSGKSRREKGLSPQVVLDAYEKKIAEGQEPRNIAGILATRFSKSPTYIRALLRASKRK
jgi:hypothetical protein